jgi:hypothetical protein
MPANCFNSSMNSIHEKEMQLKDVSCFVVVGGGGGG